MKPEPPMPESSEMVPPQYLSDEWDIVDRNEAKRLERDQIDYIENIMRRILQLEYMQYVDGIDVVDILSDIKMELKYQRIRITIRKEYPITVKAFVKSLPKKIATIALDHPLRALGVVTLWSFI